MTMNDIIATFDPTEAELNSQTLKFLGTTIALIALLIFGYFYKVDAKNRNYKNMLMMLTTFGILIFGGSAFFSHWTTVKLTPVVITSSTVETPYGTIAHKDIHNAYFHKDQQYSKLTQQKVNAGTRFLIIREFNKKEHPLSEDYYDIDKIFATMKEHIKQK